MQASDALHCAAAMPDEYRILKTLGQGTYGKVYKVERKRDGAILVLKQVALGELTPREREDVLNEVRVRRGAQGADCAGDPMGRWAARLTLHAASRT